MQAPPSNLIEAAVAVDETSAERAHDQPEAMLHWTLLGLSSVVVLLAMLLQVRGETQVVLPVIGVPLPGTCTFKQFVGADCPGCGLTRCFISMGHGRVARAWHFNPVGVALFAVVASQIPFRAIQLWRTRRGTAEFRLGWWGYSTMLLVLAALLVQWVFRMIFTFT